MNEGMRGDGHRRVAVCGCNNAFTIANFAQNLLDLPGSNNRVKDSVVDVIEPFDQRDGFRAILEGAAADSLACVFFKPAPTKSALTIWPAQNAIASAGDDSIRAYPVAG